MKFKSYLILLLILFVLSLAVILFLSTFTRLHADDYCIAADFNRLDTFSFFSKWFSSWTGRFSYIMFAGFLSLGGSTLASWLPIIGILIWGFVLSWAILPFTNRVGFANPILISLNAAALNLLVLFSVTPNLFQSVFWKDGLINYCFPLIGFTFVMGLIGRVCFGQIKNKIVIVLISVFSFINGGYSEVFSTMQVVSFLILIGMGLMFADPKNRKYQLRVAIAGVVGAIFALLVVLSAPGNQIRIGLLSEPPGMLRIISFSIRNAIYIVAKFFIWTPGWAFLTVFVSFVSGWFTAINIEAGYLDKKLSRISKQVWYRGLVLIPIVTSIIVISACAPVVFMLNAYPDDRTIILPLYFIVFGVMAFSGLFGFGFQRFNLISSPINNVRIKRIVIYALFLSVTFATTSTVWNTFTNTTNYQEYARNWDKRDQELRSEVNSGKQELTVFGLESRFGLADLRIEPNYWVNKCMADYYNIPVLFGK